DPAHPLDAAGDVGLRSDLTEPVPLSSLDDGSLHRRAILPRPEQLSSRGACHAVAEEVHAPTGDRHLADPEVLDRRQGTAVQLFEQRGCTGALHLVAVDRPPSGGVGDLPDIVLDRHVEAACLGMEVQPVVDPRPRYQFDAPVREVEEDTVTDDIAFGAARDQLLGTAGREVLDRVDAYALEERDDV